MGKSSAMYTFESPKWVTDHLWKVGLKQISNNFQRPKVTRIRKTLTKELNRFVSKKILFNSDH